MTPISTRDLELLPGIDQIQALLQSLALLDAILSPDWEYRCYAFNSNWGTDEQMGSMRNGSGDEFFAYFNQAGCFLKGFAHESPMTPYRIQPPEPWPDLLKGVPDEFSEAMNEPAFSMEEITFCIWRRQSDAAWVHGPIAFPEGDDPDGSAELLSLLVGDPESYRRFAVDYHETEIPLDPIQHIYRHSPLTEEVVRSLNPDMTISALREDRSEIGYPIE